jgi:hypothetical protein
MSRGGGLYICFSADGGEPYVFTAFQTAKQSFAVSKPQVKGPTEFRLAESGRWFVMRGDVRIGTIIQPKVLTKVTEII